MRSHLARAIVVIALAFACSSSGFPQTALDEYVARPDPVYGYRLYHTDRTLAYTSYFLELTSQHWRDPSEVHRTLWQHEVQITVPALLHSSAPETALLIINGGRNGRPLNKETGELLSTLAILSGSAVAMVNQIPNQPLSFTDEVDRPRTEDAILAYTLDKFLVTQDPEWPVHVAMTKAVVRAMDSIQSFLATRDIEIADFIPIGGSKRGWTAWLTAAVDARVKAVIPISIDLLNLEQQFVHHFEVYGFYADAIEDYVEFDLPCRVRSSLGHDLLQIIDPYTYRDRYTIPKLIINSAGDQFFLPDSSRFYFEDLPEPKQLRYTFNTDHSQGEDLSALLDVALSALSWISDVNEKREPPRFSWSFDPDGAIRVLAEDRPEAVFLVQASNPAARDFRLESIGAAWTRTELAEEGRGIYVGRVEPPTNGWTAFGLELVYGRSPATRQVFTSDVRIVPDAAPFFGSACVAEVPGYLENPQPDGWHSGIAVLSGWVCEADIVDLRLDGRSIITAGYGSPRADTQSVCGDGDNGFGLLVNLNELGNGRHLVEALADGRTFGRAEFQIQTLGEPFISGLSRTYPLADFPLPGDTTTVTWEEGLQNFVIIGTSRGDEAESAGMAAGFQAYPEAFLENPRHGSTQSGITVVSGWVCDAETVELRIDDGRRIRVPYGTPRSDTREICGDIDNGFGLLVNLSELGDGTHTIDVYADGTRAIGTASFDVVTFGDPFVRGLGGVYDLPNFPYEGDATTIQWQESLQNFVIRGR
jgi:PhoPQ-activated pathogenicity-related protein